jgi:hypothetical protein
LPLAHSSPLVSSGLKSFGENEAGFGPGLWAEEGLPFAGRPPPLNSYIQMHVSHFLWAPEFASEPETTRGGGRQFHSACSTHSRLMKSSLLKYPRRRTKETTGCRIDMTWLCGTKRRADKDWCRPNVTSLRRLSKIFIAEWSIKCTMRR